MPIVAGVRLRHSKTLWFDPADTGCVAGDVVIVSTQRGEEIGAVTSDPTEVEESALAAPLKPILRVATEADLERAVELSEREKEALPIFKRLVTEHELDIKPIDVDYLFGGDKIVFYFASEDRVDFRNLVRDLANSFHARIDMRQVGVRDQARMVGGIGHCGEMLCCKRMGGEFQPVSIKMAKTQGLSLNPVKISGQCGRLMCCLRYEADAYADFAKRSPKKNALIKTPRGDAKVTHLDFLREVVTMRFQDSEGGTVSVPLVKMDCACNGECKCSVSKETLKEIAQEEESRLNERMGSFTAPLRDSERVVDNGAGAPKSKNGKRPARGNGDAQADTAAAAEPKRRSRRRRGGSKGSSSAAEAVTRDAGTTQSDGAGEKSGEGGAPKKRSRRGGRRRGGSKNGQPQGSQASQASSSGSGSAAPSGSGDQRSPHVAPTDTRVPRRRRRER